ncbi:hypothetical protein ACFQ9X_11990 [Catenulispora yoronensis]
MIEDGDAVGAEADNPARAAALTARADAAAGRGAVAEYLHLLIRATAAVPTSERVRARLIAVLKEEEGLFA